jgi:hypothetical protein
VNAYGAEPRVGAGPVPAGAEVVPFVGNRYRLVRATALRHHGGDGYTGLRPVPREPSQKKALPAPVA